MITADCDQHVLMVHSLSNGDLTKQELIWGMNEEDVQMALYLRRVDRLNEEWVWVMGLPDQ